MSTSKIKKGDMVKVIAGREIDKEGKVLEKNDLQNSAGEFNYISSVCADKDGNLYLGSDNAVIVIDEKGNILSKIDVGNWISGIACKDDGTVYISTYSQSGNGLVLRAVDLKSKSLGEEITGVGDFNAMVFGKGDEVYLIAEMTAYKFDLKTKEKTPMWDWVNADVYETYNGELFDNGDGTYFYDFSEPKILTESHYPSRVKSNVVDSYYSSYEIVSVSP